MSRVLLVVFFLQDTEEVSWACSSPKCGYNTRTPSQQPLLHQPKIHPLLTPAGWGQPHRSPLLIICDRTNRERVKGPSPAEITLRLRITSSIWGQAPFWDAASGAVCRSGPLPSWWGWQTAKRGAVASGHLIVSTVGRGNDRLVKPKGLPPTRFNGPGKKRGFVCEGEPEIIPPDGLGEREPRWEAEIFFSTTFRWW